MAALLDLRSLNEAIAGETGFVRVGPQGGFVRGDGQAIRFWAVNTDTGRHAFVAKPFGLREPPDLQRHARFLAKRGVNMVRLHRQLSPDAKTQPGAKLEDVNTAERDAIWRTVAAMRKEGVYTTLSPYWAGAMPMAPKWGLGSQAPWGLLFFDARLQAAYKSWLRQLLVPPNPYTGVALARDPSLAIIQIQNEDSLLFWTVDTLRGVPRDELEARFGSFLVAKHGSLAAAVQTWTGERIEAGPLAAGRAPLLPTWELTQPRTGGRAARLADQTEFLARTMHDFNAMIVRYLRDDLGVKALVNAGNWKTASATRLNDAERWSYGPGEVDAANVYTGGVHQGRHNGWAIVDGDRFTNVSVLTEPRRLPLALKQSLGSNGTRPMIVTEGTWVMPNVFAAEGPFLVAAYGALLGIDGYYWFSTGDEGWTAPGSANGWLASQGKWVMATPEMLGAFPAAAWAYRMGYLDEGAPVLTERRALTDLWLRRTPLIAESPTFDPNRDAGDVAPASNLKTALPAEAFLVGPVRVQHGADPARSEASPLSGIGNGQIRAHGGQVVLDHARGYATVDAPRAQGVAAHFDKVPLHKLSTVSFESGNAYGAALAVSLDGEPLARSRRVLVQYATQSRPTGWQEKPATIEVKGEPPRAGFEIRSFGRAPWQVVSARLEVSLHNPALREAVVLDMNGMPASTVPLRRTATGVSLRFPAQAMYVILR